MFTAISGMASKWGSARAGLWRGSRALRLAATLVLATGCSRGPGAIGPVSVDPGGAASAAMAAYDANGDGALDDVELAAVPGILMHKDKYDLDGDGRVSRQEIADRIALWRSQAMGITSIDVIVKLDKRPLAGAEISFVPEEYLGPGPKVATGVTDARGYAKMGVALEELPEALRTARL
ncbi:MAG TPA: hypothetical protein PKC18_20740, partial [Lacipirellulaceae bacterium]|nr:hypothetical protein [Lacipirellulaceae bacterium]